MATAAVTWTSLPDTPPDKTKSNTNFTDLVSFNNTNVIQADGSLAFTALPSVTGAPDPVSDGAAVCKKFVDSTKRAFSERSYHRQTSNADYASGSASRAQWGEAGTVTIPSWAVNAMATVSFPIIGCGNDAPFGYSAWHFWLSLDPAETYITAFAGDTNDHAWGDADQQSHDIQLRQYISIAAPLRGTTSTCHICNQRLSGGGIMVSGDPKYYTIYDFTFWSD